MKDIETQNKLSLLNYTWEWLDNGLLTEQILNEQVVEFEKGEDANTEHFRYRLLSTYLNLHKAIEDKMLYNIFNIIQRDADRAMASSVAIKLLNNPYLNKEQFNSVKTFVLIFGEDMAKYVEKAEKNRL